MKEYKMFWRGIASFNITISALAISDKYYGLATFTGFIVLIACTEIIAEELKDGRNS